MRIPPTCSWIYSRSSTSSTSEDDVRVELRALWRPSDCDREDALARPSRRRSDRPHAGWPPDRRHGRSRESRAQHLAYHQSPRLDGTWQPRPVGSTAALCDRSCSATSSRRRLTMRPAIGPAVTTTCRRCWPLLRTRNRGRTRPLASRARGHGTDEHGRAASKRNRKRTRDHPSSPSISTASLASTSCRRPAFNWRALSASGQ